VQLTTGEGRCNQNSKDTVVASHEQAMPDNALPVSAEEMEGIGIPDDECMNFDESHRFKVTLPLERSLNKARQSVETDHLKVFHNLKIYVNLHNPDGHVSQVRANTEPAEAFTNSSLSSSSATSSTSSYPPISPSAMIR
jgi:hypothetical protein